jgi:hypothetical protein
MPKKILFPCLLLKSLYYRSSFTAKIAKKVMKTFAPSAGIELDDFQQKDGRSTH